MFANTAFKTFRINSSFLGTIYNTENFHSSKFDGLPKGNPHQNYILTLTPHHTATNIEEATTMEPGAVNIFLVIGLYLGISEHFLRKVDTHKL